MRDKKYYIDKDELWSEIELYYEKDQQSIDAGNGSIQMSNKLGSMLISVADKLMTSRSFSGYPYKDQMIGDAVLRMVKTINEKKFQLYGQVKAPSIEEREFMINLTILDDIPHGCFVARGVGVDDAEFYILMEPIQGRFFKDSRGNLTQAYSRGERVKVKTERCNTGTHINCFVESGRKKQGVPVCEGTGVFTDDGEPVMQRNNAFGYLSLIATREAITRIKKEGRQYEAVKEYQCVEFCKFMSENPEMASQRIEDDTYSYFKE